MKRMVPCSGHHIYIYKPSPSSSPPPSDSLSPPSPPSSAATAVDPVAPLAIANGERTDSFFIVGNGVPVVDLVIANGERMNSFFVAGNVVPIVILPGPYLANVAIANGERTDSFFVVANGVPASSLAIANRERANKFFLAVDNRYDNIDPMLSIFLAVDLDLGLRFASTLFDRLPPSKINGFVDSKIIRNSFRL